MTHIGIIAVTLTGNHGAEAMVSAAIGRLRERIPDTRFHIFSYYPKEDAKLQLVQDVQIHDARPIPLLIQTCLFALLARIWFAVGGKNVPKWFPKSVTAMSSCCVLLDLPGVSFVDSRIKFIPYNVATLFPALILKIPVVKLSQAIGPITHPLNKLFARMILPRCLNIFARGNSTESTLQSFSSKKKIKYELATDIAFLHTVNDIIGKQGENAALRIYDAISSYKQNHTTKIIAICPSSVVERQFEKNGRSYTAFLEKICIHLVSQGHKIVLIPNATREDSDKRHNNDLPLLKRLSTQLFTTQILSQDDCWVIDFGIDAGGIKRLLAICDIAVVSRFHAMIFCLTEQVPVIVAGWGHKYREVMAQFDLSEFEFDAATCEDSQIIESLDKLLTQRDAISEKIGKHLPNVKKTSMSQIMFVSNFVLKPIQ